MKAVIDSVIKLISPPKIKLDDFADRMCYRYTPMLLALFMFITGTVDYFGKPLSCLVPTHFSAAWASYVHQYCYVTGTYVKIENVNDMGVGKAKVFVHYYQWVPFAIIVQALAMRLPHSLWRKGQQLSDVDFDYVNELCKKARVGASEERKKKLMEAAEHIFRVAKSRNFRNGIGSLVSYSYMFYKVLNIFMLVAQIIFLNWFVGYKNLVWGLTLVRQSWSNTGYEHTFTHFPRVAYCKVGRDFLGNSQGGLVDEIRCALVVNMLNEKVFLVLFFWYYALILITVFNALSHAYHLLSAFRITSIRTLLSIGAFSKDHKMANLEAAAEEEREHKMALATPSSLHKRKAQTATSVGGGSTFIATIRDTWSWSGSEFSEDNVNHPNNHSVERFGNRVLGQDGVVLLQFVRQNGGGLIAAELATCLYRMHDAK